MVSGGLEGSLKFSVGQIPADLRVGDLLAFPCMGLTTLHDIRA